MEMIKCIQLEKESAGRSLFTIQQLSLQAGQKVGLVGNNGVGKSTFLKILLGLDRDFAGQIEVKADWAYVPQLQERSSLSGGEQVWKSIQEAFAQRPQLLIMDEPTANLDQDHQEKLIKQIKRYRGSLLVVSHDRHFLNQIASHIWHLEEGKVQVYLGNYEAFVESHRARREGQQEAYEAYQKKVAQLKKSPTRASGQGSEDGEERERDRSQPILEEFVNKSLFPVVELKQSIPRLFHSPPPHSSNCLGDSLRLEMKRTLFATIVRFGV
ncbi:ATP-binding cassette domain-containing protein [Streptococcus suis]|uniref:ABC transporter ATPase n=1 Tax=Streptococcus suis TaxID=1307 RepID=A0A116MIE6_STRSU|nr:ATP-binding cassette domain-containing protein [Streptococcus suis]CYV45855.1 ABC transporter ATPase [Streptococcus suis]CYV49460.1 ABC transporter ATPase [Streptococcus suis]